MRKLVHAVDVAVVVPCLYLASFVLLAWWGRLFYPYDLEWMEGGMLVHAWRIHYGLPVYTEPTPDWIPFIYPPGYSALVAALGFVFPLGPPLARAVSALSTLTAVGALVFAGVRHGRSWAGGLLAGCFFLVCYPSTAAFYDLIRPDGLAIALTGWALVLGMERQRRWVIVAGLLLAAAFTAKHNVALFGLPMALGIWADQGWRRAGWFTLASAGPGALFTAFMEVQTGGHFISWIVSVPAAHPSVLGRFFPGTFLELGNDVGFLLPGLLTAFVVASTVDRSKVEVAAVVGLAALGSAGGVLAGQNVEAVYALFGPQPRLPTFREWVPYGPEQAYALTGGAIGTVVAVLLLSLVRRQALRGRWVYGTGVAATALVLAGLMRAHHGGFTNVYMPVHFVAALTASIAVGRIRLQWPNALVGTLVVFPLVFQIAHHGMRFEPERFVPAPVDVEAGDAFVASLIEHCGEGPVLSPTNPWMAQRAGFEPAWHIMALWDIQHVDSPYYSSVRAIDRAVAQQHWTCVVMPSGRPLRHGIATHYVQKHRPVVGPSPRGRKGTGPFMPRTGWRARPGSIWVPKDR